MTCLMGSVLNAVSELGGSSAKTEDKTSPYQRPHLTSFMSEVGGDSVRAMQPVLPPNIQSQILTGGGIIFPPSEGQSSEGAIGERHTSNQPIILETRRREAIQIESNRRHDTALRTEDHIPCLGHSSVIDFIN